MKRSPLAALTAFLAALFVLALAGPALAHDSLKSSDPAKGATVEPVGEVSLVFSSGVKLPTVLVRDADNAAHQEGKPAVDGSKVRQALKGTLSPGTYTIAYRVVSSDGHPIEGEIPFTVKGAVAPEQPKQPVVAKEEAATQFPIWLVIVVGALVGIGIGFLLSVKKKKP